MDEASAQSMLRAYPDLVTNPFERTYPFTIHIEVEAYYQDEAADERLMAFLEEVEDLIEVSIDHFSIHTFVSCVGWRCGDRLKAI